jgi:hypothetical protein
MTPPKRSKMLTPASRPSLQANIKARLQALHYLRKNQRPPRKATLAEVLEDAGAQHDAELAQHAATLIAVVSNADPDVARAIGVDLKDIEAAAVTLRDIKAIGAGATGIRAHGVKARGDFTIERVTAEDSSKKT